MKYYKTAIMAVSSIFALAILGGCDQKGDTKKEMTSETEAAVEKVDASSTMVKDAADNMTEKMTTAVEDTKEKATTMVEDAKEQAATMVEDAQEQATTVVESAEKMISEENDAGSE